MASQMALDDSVEKTQESRLHERIRSIAHASEYMIRLRVAQGQAPWEVLHDAAATRRLFCDEYFG